MSLDVMLIADKPVIKAESSGIFVRENGKTVEISRDEWDRRNPGRTPVVYQNDSESSELYSANITHNLTKMADAAGLYIPLWRPDEMGIEVADELITPLVNGYQKLTSDPEKFKQFNPDNGWGDYDGLVEFTANYLLACIRYPKAKVEVSR